MFKILPWHEAVLTVMTQPKKYNVVSILSRPERQTIFQRHNIHISEVMEKHSKNHLQLFFDDVPSFDPNKSSPQVSDLVQAIDFVKGKSPIIFHCWAGISRSSSICFTTICKHHGYDVAISCINPARHCPNDMVVEFARTVIGDDHVESLKKYIHEHEQDFLSQYN